MNVYMALTFGTTEGKLYTMRIPRAVESAGASLVKNAMDALIGLDCIGTSRGDLFNRKGAKIIKVTHQDISMD